MLDNFISYIVALYRLSFVVGIASLYIAKIYIPDFLEYGKTLKNHSREDINPLLDKVMHFTVPKAYFSHFYILSLILSIITVTRYYQYPITWILLFHSSRRLYETLFVSKYTGSRMNWSHYIVGLWFYSVLHIILGIKLASEDINPNLNMISFCLFLYSSREQFKTHQILARLKKYSLPKDRLFQYICCPHYLCEIGIYVSFVPYNLEFLFPLIWVIISLSVSAVETRKYYQDKFKENMVPKYAIIPYIL